MNALGACPVCRSSDRHELYQVQANATVFCVQSCHSCGLGYIDPQPTWAELQPWYDEEYKPYDPEHDAGVERQRLLDEARRTGVLRHIPVRPGMRLLDVGCGGGFFLSLAKSFGVDVSGVEPSQVAAERARVTGCPVYCGTLEQFAETGPGPYDGLCASHVLEHVPDPVATLGVMRRLLVPGGVATIIVPNAQSRGSRLLKGHWHSADVPRHLMHFSPESLRVASEAAGFTSCEVMTYSLPRAVASTVRIILRRRFLIPNSMSARSGVDRLAARVLAPRDDRACRGEAIIAHMRAGAGPR